MENLLSWLMSQKGAGASLTMELFGPEDAMSAKYVQQQVELVDAAQDELVPGYELKSLARHAKDAEKGFVGPFDRLGRRLHREAVQEGTLDKYAAVGWRGDDREDFFVISVETVDSGTMVRVSASLAYAAAMADDVSQVEKFVNLARKAWTSLPLSYGCANLGVSDESKATARAEKLMAQWSAQSQVSLADYTPHREEKVVPLLSSKVKGALWLNLLSEQHVEALGGMETVDRALPEDIRIEEFKNGGLLIQLTPTPELDNSPETQAKFEALKGLLAPILI